MDLAFITPTIYLDKFSKQGNIYLALAHLIDDNGENEYTSFHRREAKRGERVILDNGLFEGSQVPAEALIHRAKLIGAQVVCAPDVLYDSRATIKEFKNFIKLKHEKGLVAKVMGIPQASNPADWWECWQFMEMHEECSLIGLSILSVPKAFGRSGDKWTITTPRINLIQQLSHVESFLKRRIKPIHLLGLGESYADIHTAKRLLPDTILSNDSSSAFVHGLYETTYTRLGIIPGGKISERLDFNQEKVSSEIEKHIQLNIDTAKEIAL